MWWIYTPFLWIHVGLNIFLHASPLPSRRTLKSYDDYYDDGTVIEQLTLEKRNGTAIAYASVQGGCESYPYGEGIAKQVWIVSCDKESAIAKEPMDLFPCEETPVCPKRSDLARSNCIKLIYDSLSSDAVAQDGIALDLKQKTYESGWNTERKISRLSIKKPTGFANAYIKLNAKHRVGGCSGKKHVELRGIVTHATVDFVVDWELLQMDVNCSYSGELWLQNACFEDMRKDKLPELKYLEEPQSLTAARAVRRPWWLLVVAVTAPPIAVALFCSVACRSWTRPAVGLQNGNSNLKSRNSEKLTRREVLVAYAGDMSEEVLPLLKVLRERKDIKLLDLHDPHAYGKRQDPTVWLAKKLLDNSTKTLIVASKGARTIQQLVEAESKLEIRSIGDKIGSCEAPRQREAVANKKEEKEKEEEEEKEKEKEKGRETLERMEEGRREGEEEHNKLKIPESQNGTKDLKHEDVSRAEKERKEDARNGQRTNQREQVYHTLLVDFLIKMKNEQFDVCQVLIENTPTTDLLDDIPKTRVYRWPDHRDHLLAALRV
ncbi:uncharacterized protein LOC125043863 isoform X2 [Penaeus chinensis]|uniref:uncharacterized protein LOC125043863 isoform X2 n=1 Tax=Penaeus chinensis TaxID=139456 RepID=UPI001FB7E12B|nr:uncharacterized protein LOC125043863 isoform X2 [Penaeus chinensis]